MTFLRNCPKCGKAHYGEGLSPSVVNKLHICNDCYRIREKLRHTKNPVDFGKKVREPIVNPNAPLCEGCGSPLTEHVRGHYNRFHDSFCNSLYWRILKEKNYVFQEPYKYIPGSYVPETKSKAKRVKRALA